MEHELNYRITDIKYLPECKSNLSQDYSLEIKNYVNNNKLTGTRIAVRHKVFGIVYAYVVNAEGNLVDTEYIESSIPSILDDLKRFGYNIIYEEYKYLPQEQIDYLKSLLDLKFDHLRFIQTHDNLKPILVAFKLKDNPKWISIFYKVKGQEYEKAILSGTAFNISEKLGPDYNWNFLIDKTVPIQYLIDKQENHE